MNDPNNDLNAGSEEELSEFERSLGKRSLGTGPDRRGELMYECGYAAGVTATQKNSRRTIVRWRGVGLAASVLACISSFAAFSNSGSDRMVEISQQSSQNIPKTSEKGTLPANDPWLALMTQDRQAHESSQGILRASSTIRFDFDPEPLTIDSNQTSPIQQDTPLRPGDFPLFL